MRVRDQSVLLVMIFLVSACGATREMAIQPPSPVVGTWNYTIESADGVFTGYLMVTDDEESGLKAYISEEAAQVGDSIEAELVEFDQETQKFSFSFDHPEYGRLNVMLTLEEQEMNGFLHVVQFSLDVPMILTYSEQ